MEWCPIFFGCPEIIVYNLLKKTWGRHYLVGGIPTPLKNMKVNWDHSSQYMEKY